MVAAGRFAQYTDIPRIGDGCHTSSGNADAAAAFAFFSLLGFWASFGSAGGGSEVDATGVVIVLIASRRGR